MRVKRSGTERLAYETAVSSILRELRTMGRSSRGALFYCNFNGILRLRDYIEFTKPEGYDII